MGGGDLFRTNDYIIYFTQQITIIKRVRESWKGVMIKETSKMEKWQHLNIIIFKEPLE